MVKRKRGWFGNPYKHSLAARGERVKGKKIISIENIILSDMEKARRPLSIQQISRRTKLSWPTVNKHMTFLEKKKKTICVKKGNRRICEIPLRRRR